MSYRTLEELFASLPEHIKIRAIHDHILELGMAENLYETVELFNKLQALNDNVIFKAQTVYFLICYQLRHNNLEAAQHLYQILAELPQEADAENIWVKAACTLISALYSTKLQAACTLWLDLAHNLSADGLKWRVARTGLLLLKQAYRNSDRRMAKKIYRILQKMRHAPYCSQPVVGSKNQSFMGIVKLFRFWLPVL